MNSVCFACGHEKSDPLVVCGHCQVKPISDKDRIHSMCLSQACFNTDTLLKASRYIREKHKLPKFGEKAMSKATTLYQATQRNEQEYTLMGVDDSFFDFDGFSEDDGETVTVHSIGRPIVDPDKGPENGISHLGNRSRTYQTLQWKLGADISIDDADANVDEQGELYIQYAWKGEHGWTWKHVSKTDFDQLKTLEDSSH